MHLFEGLTRGGEVHASRDVALASVLEGIWLHVIDDLELGNVLVAEFVLRGTDEAERPPDITLATRVEHWRGLLDSGRPIVPSETDPGISIGGRHEPGFFGRYTFKGRGSQSDAGSLRRVAGYSCVGECRCVGGTPYDRVAKRLLGEPLRSCLMRQRLKSRRTARCTCRTQKLRPGTAVANHQRDR